MKSEKNNNANPINTDSESESEVLLQKEKIDPSTIVSHGIQSFSTL